mmetsp:Transcript_41640/g.131214  ORF Transcript_41640/g.131214 Transcript_41640/m.131214 type:complete len:184 (+) Transcript_41640:1451-2002(+)
MSDRRWSLIARFMANSRGKNNLSDIFDETQDESMRIDATWREDATSSPSLLADDATGSSRVKVPLQAYEHMEREVLQLQEELKEKEIALQERTELIEHLERKLQVLSHARSAEIRKLKRESSVNKGSTGEEKGMEAFSPRPLKAGEPEAVTSSLAGHYMRNQVKLVSCDPRDVNGKRGAGEGK